MLVGMAVVAIGGNKLIEALLKVTFAVVGEESEAVLSVLISCPLFFFFLLFLCFRFFGPSGCGGLFVMIMRRPKQVRSLIGWSGRWVERSLLVGVERTAISSIGITMKIAAIVSVLANRMDVRRRGFAGRNSFRAARWWPQQHVALRSALSLRFASEADVAGAAFAQTYEFT